MLCSATAPSGHHCFRRHEEIVPHLYRLLLYDLCLMLSIILFTYTLLQKLIVSVITFNINIDVFHNFCDRGFLMSADTKLNLNSDNSYNSKIVKSALNSYSIRSASSNHTSTYNSYDKSCDMKYLTQKQL